MAWLKNAKDVTVSSMPLSATQLAGLHLIEDGVIGKIGKDILPDPLEVRRGANRSATSSRRGSEQIS